MGLIQKAFGDIITFSRSSNATRIGPTGRVEYAPHNLILQSQTFDNAGWTKTNSTVTANATAAPDGTVTADKLISGSGVANNRITQNFTFADGFYNLSIYAKAAEWAFVVIGWGGPNAYFNLSNGTIGTVSLGTASIQSVGGGWYRCSLQVPVTAGTDNFRIYAADSNGGIGNNGDGTSGIYIWGAQLSVGPLPLDYTPTTSAAVYGPRFDFDPVTLAARGLLIEEQRTNACTYSENIANAVWSPSEATVSANAAVSPDGTVSAYSLTFNATNGQIIRTNPIGLITVSGSTTYTISVWLKVTSGTFKLKLSRTNSATWTTATVSPELTVTTTWQRFTLTYTSGAGDSFTDIIIGSENKTPYTLPATGTVLVWGVQHEAGSFATSYIPTLASTVTRSADVASVNTLSPWFNATEGTLFAEHQAIYPSQGNVVASINDNSANRSVELQHRGTTPSVSFGSFTVVSGSITGQADAGTTASYNALRKWAGAYKVNDFAASQNGGAVGVDTSGAVPSGLTQMQLMAAYWSSAASTSGWLRRVAYYPRRLANAELQALTA